jgi:drug/metabolite transporter (DMT)-like permease
MLFWSMSYIWVKIVYQCYNPITTVFLRLLIASPILYLYSKLTKKIQRIRKEDIGHLVWLSLLQPFLYFLFESFGLKQTSPTVAAVIISTIPLFTPVVAYYQCHEKLSPMNIVGLAVSFFGVLVVIVKGDFSLAASPMGLILLLGATATGVIYTTSLKKLALKYNSLSIVMYQNILGIFLFLPFFLWFDLKSFLSVSPPFNVLSSLVLLAILPTSMSFILYTTSVKELGAARASMFGNIMPVFTALLAWFVLDESLSFQMMLGILLVIAGLFVSQRRRIRTGKNSIVLGAEE